LPDSDDEEAAEEEDEDDSDVEMDEIDRAELKEI